MKYPYDKGFRKSMVNMPFRGFICKLTQKPMERMLKKVKIPNGITMHDFWIPGYSAGKGFAGAVLSGADLSGYRECRDDGVYEAIPGHTYVECEKQ